MQMNRNLNRINAIDGIRGFSLFGILLANLLIFQYGLWGKDEIHLFQLSTIDHWFYAFTKIAVEGSFMPIFTFLFGYSMILMRNSLEQKNAKIKWHFFRRSLLLITFGLLHGTFLWDGDILLLYGIMGLFLLFFLNRKAKTILIWAVSLFVIFGVLHFIPLEDDDIIERAQIKTYVERTTDIYSSGTYSEIKEHRNNGEDPFDKLEESKLAFILLLSPIVIAPMFLFGMYAAKRELFFHPKREKKLYLILGMVCGVLGLSMKIYGFTFHHEGIELTGGPILSFGYIFMLAMMYSSLAKSRLLRAFENVGKLSLTNYILQSVICTTIFYGYGYGLFGKIGVFLGTVLGIVIFCIQITFSSLYTERFRYGPLEKVMRFGTYLSFRKASNHDERKVA